MNLNLNQVNLESITIEFDVHGMIVCAGTYQLSDVETVIEEQRDEVPSTRVYLILQYDSGPYEGKLSRIEYEDLLFQLLL